MPPVLSTAPRSASAKAAEAAQLKFDWLLGDRNFWTFKALSGLTDMSDSFLEKLWEDKAHDLHISGHEYNAGEKAARMSRRVARAFVVRLLVGSARYSAEDKLSAYLSCLREFSPAELHAIATEAHRRAITPK